MAYPKYLRDKARELRVRKKLNIDQLAERLCVSRTTVYYWVRDLPLQRSRQSAGQRKGNHRMQVGYRHLREEAYEEGRRSFSALCYDPTFRDFVNLYIGEGYKRRRNVVSLCNSDPAVVVLASRWIQRLGSNKVSYSVQYHADQDVASLRAFWSQTLDITPEAIALQRKSNSTRMARRTWRCRYGVLTVLCNDTLFRARLEAWMDCVKEQWLYTRPLGA